MTEANQTLVRSFKVNRPVTTLGQNPKFALDKGAAGQKFLYFFNNRFGGKGKRPFWVFASLAANILADDSVSFSGVTATSHRVYRQSVQKRFQEIWKTIGAGETVNVRKNVSDGTFTIAVPVFVHPMSGVDANNSLMAYCGFDTKSLEPGQSVQTNPLSAGFSRPLAEVFKRGNVSEKDRKEWAACKAEVRVSAVGNAAVFVIVYTMSKEEAQFLVNEDFQFIRSMDVYGPVYEWVSSYYGQSGLSPAFSIPLRQISRSVKDSSAVHPPTPRVSTENLLIDEHAKVLWLPADLDDINRFEDVYTTAFTDESTSVFGVIDVLSGNSTGTKRKPPTPMPVFVDWVNLKFAYTNQRGRLNVISMDRTYPVNSTHEFRVLDQKITSDNINNVISQTLALSDFYATGFFDFKVFMKSIFDYARTYEGAEPTDVKMSDFMDYSTEVYGPPLQQSKAFKSVATKVLNKIQDSPETAYARFSVPNILQLRGALTIILKNWGKLSELKSADRNLRKSYIGQAVDPSYTLPPLPLVSDGRGLMPHQFKCLNLSKDSPAHVLYPVDAGGGKCLEGSTLVYTNHGLLTLQEIHDTFAGEPSKADSRFKRVNAHVQVKSLRGYEDVTQVFKRRGQLWETTLDNGTRFKGLKEHKFWTQRGWVKTEDLTLEDWIAAPTNTNLFGSLGHVPADLLHLDWTPSFNTKLDRQTRIRALQSEYATDGVSVGYELGLVLGALVAEGGGATFHNTDKEFVDLYVASFRNVFKCDPIVRGGTHTRVEGRKPLFSVFAPNQYVSLVITTLLGNGEVERKYSHEKTVPSVVRMGSKETQRGFLQAWFEGDGYAAGVNTGTASYRVSCGTISKTLAVQATQMLRNFGVAVRQRADEETGKSWVTTLGGRGEALEKRGYGLSVETSSLAVFQREIGFLCSRKSNHLDKAVRKQVLATKTAQGLINLSAQGRSQRVPYQVVDSVVCMMSEALAAQERVTNYSSVRNGTSFDSTVVGCHSIHTAQKEYNSNAQARLNVSRVQLSTGARKGHTSKHVANDVLQFAQKHPLLKNLRKTPEFSTAIQFLKASINSNWTKVLSVVDTKVKDFVYDLSVPGSNSYVANGHYTHNTMIYMADLLREYGHFKTPGPFMIMCPSHLVAQYVKEIVYATDGRLNAIPITSYTVRRNKLPRLKSMIESAPDNTVLIVDYNVVTLGTKTMAYGTDSIRVYPVVEFLRQFGITVVYSDETHYLKSESQRQQSVHRLIADIPKKRGASGTFTADTIKDLVKQAALFDPSVFGTVDDFIKEFALEVRGTKVLSWKPGTEARVKMIMKENFVYSEAKRKEWAAILPKPVERFHKVDLSQRQMEVYNQILTQAIESLTAEMEKNEALRSLLGGRSNAVGEDGEPVEADGDEADDTVSLDQLLKPYLARMERFLTAPGKDQLGATTLTGEDLVSPKARKIVELSMKHIEDGQPGKVLIFTNYKLTAEAIYEAFPESFRHKVILYTAGEKERCGAEFEKNDEKQVMVGVEVSMNTGLNLQFCSRLIRCETVWIPGTLEQGNARIGRPNIKVKEERPEIFYDWIISNKTIDVTKVSYLMAKTISVAKYKEAGIPAYDELEVPPLFPMRIETIMEANDFDTTMLDYFGKYEAYKRVVFKEWDDYRESNKDLLFNKDGSLKLTPLVRGETPEGAALMRRVPYVPGTEIYKAEHLGLIRYDAYMRLNDEEESEGSEEEGPESDDEEGEESETSDLAEERRLAKGLAVHTDRGDGEIVRVGRHRLTVMLPSGERFPVNKMATFVITRNETSSKDIRQNLLKMVGDIPLDAPVEVLETQMTERMKVKLERQAQRDARMKQRQLKNQDADVPEYRIQPDVVERDGEEVRVFNVIDADGEVLETFDTRRDAKKWINTPYEDEETSEEPEDEGLALDISFTMVNDMLGLRVDNHEDDEKIANLAQQYGFKYSPEYFAAEVKTPQHLIRLFKGWHESGFVMPKDNSEINKAVYNRLLERGRKALPSTVGFSTALDLKNFYREEFKPNPKENTIMPYPLIQDGILYVALPARAHPASQKAIRTVKVPGVRWMKFDSSAELILFVRTKEAALDAIRRMHKDGVKFVDLASMKKQFSKLKVVRDHS
jgi:intein/homing endonuclease